ncbi:MAG: hypothetical protein IPK79_00255 [Vampirovibrionales bacterium]|nr:hypothetical protein [Vampirovibrionales bacterium]
MSQYDNLIGLRYKQLVHDSKKGMVWRTFEVRSIVDGDQAVTRVWSRRHRVYVYQITPAAILADSLENSEMYKIVKKV